MYLGALIFGSYCSRDKHHVSTPTRQNILHHLLDAIAQHLRIDIIRLPDTEVLYRAHNGKHCGSATKEKMVLLLYLKTKPEQRETLLKAFMDIADRERLTDTPYWDSFKKEHAHLVGLPAAIHLTEPYVDCFMKCDTAQLRNFLEAIQIALDRKEVVKKKKGKKR